MKRGLWSYSMFCSDSQSDISMFWEREGYVSVEELVGWDVGNGVEWLWLARLRRCRAVQLARFKPFDTLVASEFESKASGSNNHGANIEEDVSIDSLSSKIVLFVGLYIEGCHKL